MNLHSHFNKNSPKVQRDILINQIRLLGKFLDLLGLITEDGDIFQSINKANANSDDWEMVFDDWDFDSVKELIKGKDILLQIFYLSAAKLHFDAVNSGKDNV